MIPYLELRPQSPTSFHIRRLRPFISPNDPQEPPHRHNFQEVMWVRGGNGRHVIDGDLLEITPHTFYLIAKGQVHQFLVGQQLEGYLLRFTDDFLLESSAQAAWNYRVTLFNNLTINHTLPVGAAVEPYETLLRLLLAEHDAAGGYGQQGLLRHLLLGLLLLLDRRRRELVQVGEGGNVGEETAVLPAFLQLLEEQYRHTHHVSDYARALGLTSRQLSRILQQHLGKTAKQVIEDRLMLEAKRYLLYSNASIKETAYQLGYKDPSYFSKAFKRHSGVVPQAYRP